MALSLTSLLGAISGTSGDHGTGSFVTGSFTPPNNSILVVSVSLIQNGGSSTPLTDLTISGGGLTYTARASSSIDEGGSFYTGTRIYTAPVATGASMTITLDCGSRSIGEYSISVVALTGYNTSTPTGVTGTNAQTSGFSGPPDPASLTLSGSPASTSYIVGAIGIDKSVANCSPGSSWTELHDVHNTDWGGLETQYRTSYTGTSVDWTDVRAGGGALFNWAAVAVEIVAAGGAIEQAVSAATETDTAQAITRAKARSVGMATATDAAQPVGRSKARTVGVASTTDAAQAITRAKARTVGVAGTSDTARPIARAKARTVGVASTVDTALQVVASGSLAVGTAGETSTAGTINRAKAKSIGVAVEVDQALPIAGAAFVSAAGTMTPAVVVGATMRPAVGVGAVMTPMVPAGPTMRGV